MKTIIAMICLSAIGLIVYFLNRFSRQEMERRAKLPDAERKRLEAEDDSWIQTI